MADEVDIKKIKGDIAVVGLLAMAKENDYKTKALNAILSNDRDGRDARRGLPHAGQAVQRGGRGVVSPTIDRRAVIGILKERKRGKSWEQVARRYVLGTAEDAECIVRRWLYVNDIESGR